MKTLEEKVEDFIRNQVGTAGWSQKLQAFIESERQLAREEIIDFVKKDIPIGEWSAPTEHERTLDAIKAFCRLTKEK